MRYILSELAGVLFPDDARFLRVCQFPYILNSPVFNLEFAHERARKTIFNRPTGSRGGGHTRALAANQGSFWRCIRFRASKRGAFLRVVCGTDDVLRAEVESLLAEEESVGTRGASPIATTPIAAPEVQPSEEYLATDPMIGRRIAPTKS